MPQTSEKLESVLCDPRGKVCITGSERDREILQEAIREVQELEAEVKHLKAESIKDAGSTSCLVSLARQDGLEEGGRGLSE